MVGSITKTPVSRATGVEIARDAFGTVELVGFDELTEGWFNAAYRMTLADGRSAVLKVAPPPGVTVMRYEHDIMATEVAALRTVGERTSVPVPSVLHHDTSCVRLPSELFVMEWCDGTLLSRLRPTLSDTQQGAIDGQLGGLLRQLHEIGNDGFGLQAPSQPKFGRWSDAVADLFDMVMTDAEAMLVQLPRSYDGLRAIPRRFAAELDLVTEPRFVHWDLWDANVFVDPLTLEVRGLIDFERAMWGDPLIEAQYVYRGEDAGFIAGYGSDLLASPGAHERRLVYDLYLYLLIVTEVAFRHYPTDDIERFGRSHLAATLDRLPI
jgi:aminoglycoside phosphotransferase (APT) family kinase protein